MGEKPRWEKAGNGPLYLGVYCSLPPEYAKNPPELPGGIGMPPESLSFHIRIARSRESLTRTCTPPFEVRHFLVRSIRVPEHYVDEISRELNKRRRRFIGHISFEKWHSDGETAEDSAYYPKTGLENKSAIGLPYLVDSIIVKQLAAFGFKRIKTSDFTTNPRDNQLKRVGLKQDTPYNYRQWLAAMGRGIRETAELYRKREREKK